MGTVHLASTQRLLVRINPEEHVNSLSPVGTA